MTSIPARSPFYKDFDFRFLAHPVTGKLAILKNADAIKQAVKLLVTTNRFERPFKPLLGSTVIVHLFENFSPITVADIKFAIKTAIDEYEPRAILLDVTVTGDPDSALVDVTVTFRPINQKLPVETTLRLTRLR